MGRKLASLAGIVAAALSLGLGATGHVAGQPASHHALAEDQGPTRVA